MRRSSYNRGVFINCPFDDNYNSLFWATVFTVVSCQYDPRCAKEVDDASKIRLDNIYTMIAECRYSIHDLSRTQLSRQMHLPRFNMPFELGIFLGAKRFGAPPHDKKACLIFERKPHTYEAFISDIKGQDIKAHHGNHELIISETRNWLVNNTKGRSIPGGRAIWRSYSSFNRWLPGKCRKESKRVNELTYMEYAGLIYEWLKI